MRVEKNVLVDSMFNWLIKIVVNWRSISAQFHGLLTVGLLCSSYMVIEFVSLERDEKSIVH